MYFLCKQSILLTVLITVCTACDNHVNKPGTRRQLDYKEVKSLGIRGCMDHYLVPGCTWAVLKGENLVASGAEGPVFLGSQEPIELNDHFQIGSLGKSYTAFIAAKCVEEGLIHWETKIFEMIPDWEEASLPGYAQLSLADLLSHQTNLQPLNVHQTHFDKKTNKLVYDHLPEFAGTTLERRHQFCRYALSLEPAGKSGFNYGNSGYCIAAAMLEKASGKSWEELALELASDLDMEIGFERPNRQDPTQPWGHLRSARTELTAVSPEEPRVYNDPMFAPAGNIHVSIVDFSKYVSQFLRGIQDQNGLLTSTSIHYLLHGVPDYSMGWYNSQDGESIFYHYGSEGTFFCHMMIFKDYNAAILIFTNAPNVPDTLNFLNDARNLLKDRYIYGK